MSESGGVGFLEGDQAAGELEQRQMVGGFLRPADQECAVAVEPGVAGFDDPAAGAPAGCLDFVADLLGPTANVRHEAILGSELVDPGVGVAAVEAQTMCGLGRRLGPRNRNRIEGRG